jgi:hypothetical protein
LAQLILYIAEPDTILENRPYLDKSFQRYRWKESLTEILQALSPSEILAHTSTHELEVKIY